MWVRHGTLTAGVVTSVAVPAAAIPILPGLPRLEVVNRSGTDSLWFTFDGTPPTVGGDNVLVIPPVMGSFVYESLTGPFTVRLLSPAALPWTVSVG